MALEVDATEVTGGYRIIDTDRHLSYQGVALVIQRDAHPTISDCAITREEALYRAKAMAASQDLLEAAVIVLEGLNARIDHAGNNGLPVPVFDGIADLHAAIQKATA